MNYLPIGKVAPITETIVAAYVHVLEGCDLATQWDVEHKTNKQFFIFIDRLKNVQLWFKASGISLSEEQWRVDRQVI